MGQRLENLFFFFKLKFIRASKNVHSAPAVVASAFDVNSGVAVVGARLNNLGNA